MNTPNDSPLIHLHGVHFAYTAERPVLRGCDLTVAPGDRISITGDNGSGKTTLLRLLVGLARPSEGTVTMFGRPRRSESDFRDVRGRVGLVFQNSDDQLFCPTVAEDVAFGPLNMGLSQDEAWQVVRETLHRLGLDGFEDRVVHHLSGGEKRLVALAGVLAMRPEVILMDEPTAELDAGAIDRLIQATATIDAAMVIVTHNDRFREATTSTWYQLRQGLLHQV